jgi:hypothetical protein
LARDFSPIGLGGEEKEIDGEKFPILKLSGYSYLRLATREEVVWGWRFKIGYFRVI